MRFIYGGIFLALVVGLVAYTVNQNKEREEAYDWVSSYPSAYPYQCEDGSMFSIVFGTDLLALQIVPDPGKTFPPAGVLGQVPAQHGVEYIGDDATIYGQGETLRVVTKDREVVCNPVPSTDQPPFNFGE